MGAVEKAVDAAANFVGPFVDKHRNHSAHATTFSEPDKLMDETLSHLHAINTADLAADPNAPYDASLAGVVYSLLDLITLLGVVPHLSPGVAFSQRPKSVLAALENLPSKSDKELLAKVVLDLVPILEQKGSGVQPLLSQRILPDIVSALAELSFSPTSNQEAQPGFLNIYQNIISETPTSRLLPILTTFLQQPLPAWLKPIISKELASIPLRPQGVRHTVEFLSLLYLSKNSQVPQDASGPQSEIPIPLEAVAQASRLLVLPPSGISQDEWLRKLAPQLFGLLDGNEGRGLSRAAGQIIAGGVLSKKATGAPGTVGWELFALPLLQKIHPKIITEVKPRKGTEDQIVVQEQDLKSALRRLSVIASSCPHAGLLRRLVDPLLLPLWALLNYTKARALLDKEWSSLPQAILSRYLAIACNAKQIDSIATNLFWDGTSSWTFGPGSKGGVEVRQRSEDKYGVMDVSDILSHVAKLDNIVNILVSLLAEAKIPDDTAGSIFIQTTKRWLSPTQTLKTTLTDEPEIDPLSALTNAKLSEALATKFKDQFARSPQNIIELVGQLIGNFVSELKVREEQIAKSKMPSRATLGSIVKREKGVDTGWDAEQEIADEDLVSFALSILNELLVSPGFTQTPETMKLLSSVLPPLTSLSQHHSQLPISSVVINSATNLLSLLKPSSSTATSTTPIASDPIAEHRATLKTILYELTSPEPPVRTWALNTLRKLIHNPTAFPVIDVPSMTHVLLSASLADPESYVHTAAMPVLVDLATRAPNPVIRVLIDAFVDTDERSLELGRGSETEAKEKALQHALDFRLRVGEVLNRFLLDDLFWALNTNAAHRYRSLKQPFEACLSSASRRGHRTKTLSMRTELADAERKTQEEGEAVWDGPIPNLLEPEGEDANEQVERDALVDIVHGWENTQIEEDVRIRASALSILSTIFEHRLDLLRQSMIDAALQMVLLILTMETSESKAIIRRAGVLVIMGLLRSLDTAVEEGKDISVGLSLKQQENVERVVKWVRDEDLDALVRDHAAAVVEGLETLRMKKLYRIRDEGLRLGPELGLAGSLGGLDVTPNLEGNNGKRKMIVEEI